MIHIDRSKVDEPPSLASEGAKERLEAIAFYEKQENLTRTFSFKAYKNDDVRDALNRLFHEKCAYCESHYRATAPVDIEHFRPKGAIMVQDRREKPGYYWLAASWDNLLPSCIDCNRARTQAFKDEQEDDDEIREVAGKENKFPLMSENHRARKPDREGLEEAERLLLHPCLDRPEAHLEFCPNGLVRARRRSRKGETSIEVYALRRKGLKEERLERLLRLAEQMDSILFLAERLEQIPDDTAVAQQFKRQMKRLLRETNEAEPYAGLARQFVFAFRSSLVDGTCRRFVQELLTQVSSAFRTGTPSS
jgi:uncharacterized protein (TIGR02646 family)